MRFSFNSYIDWIAWNSFKARTKEADGLSLGVTTIMRRRIFLNSSGILNFRVSMSKGEIARGIRSSSLRRMEISTWAFRVWVLTSSAVGTFQPGKSRLILAMLQDSLRKGWGLSPAPKMPGLIQHSSIAAIAQICDFLVHAWPRKTSGARIAYGWALRRWPSGTTTSELEKM